ncbi:hypothetical protein A8C32_07440 [Flavivirga aquatica]|uniref:MobA-like NTP transferase domain-containing protein n=1 Tax=Flavivirga aquatica TaxID=1849968 RepID=A0A1E5SIR8_9FLAO|nr:nucleotidyltransferase family protein [Flavivirga aquatica]OEJ99005.1 hypothetical protein A8C32_07440 [Flavivirga aquatica]
MNISIIILAAGQSSRMGRIKQLLPYEKSTLLEVTIHNALASKANNVYCVLGANSGLIKKEIKEPEVTFINNPNWKSGLSSSIVSGIKHLQTLKEHSDAVLITLADQPHVDSAYIDSLINLYQDNQGEIIASAYENKKGVPAIFPITIIDKLLKLEGDKGAKSFLNNSEYNIITLELESFQIFRDIDTPEDYKKLFK